MNIVKFRPVNDMLDWNKKMDHFFDSAFPELSRFQDEFGNWSPAVDVMESTDEFVVKADLPGMTEKDIELVVENNQLILKGERSAEKADRNDNYHKVERVYGRFYRAFNLPDTVDTKNVNAVFENGVLKVTLAKKEETKPRKISISINK